MKLLKYSDHPIDFDSDITYLQESPHTFLKPKGFWVSVQGEDDWEWWCRKEEFGVERLRVVHEVTLRPLHDVLVIDNLSNFDHFHARYRVETDDIDWSLPWRNEGHWPVDWRKVAVDYDGLIIAPYQWSRRLECNWYYGFDCASGCIWNLDAIESVEVLCEV
jgi:hypothetical protein